VGYQPDEENTIKAATVAAVGVMSRGRAHFPHSESAEGILMVTQLKLGDIAVDVVLKDIKNIHLSVYPPTGRVEISAPSRMSLDTIRVFTISKLGWIKRHQTEVQRTGTRDAARVSGSRESLRLGQTLPTQGSRIRRDPVNRIEAKAICFFGCVQKLATRRSMLSWRNGIERGSKRLCHH